MSIIFTNLNCALFPIKSNDQKKDFLVIWGGLQFTEKCQRMVRYLKVNLQLQWSIYLHTKPFVFPDLSPSSFFWIPTYRFLNKIKINSIRLQFYSEDQKIKTLIFFHFFFIKCNNSLIFILFLLNKSSLISFYLQLQEYNMNEKKKLCKFKETCPQWLAKKDCGFDHVECKFKDSCKDKQKCMFYHKQKQVFDKPKSQTLCKFGATCNKPGCPFKHEKAPQGLQGQIINKAQEKKPFQGGDRPAQVCRFGQACQRPNCRFLHPERQGQPNKVSQFQNRQQTQQKTSLSQPQTQAQINIFQGGFQNAPRRQQNKFCINYLLLNNCQNGQSCQKLHEFTEKSSFKRVFYTTQIPERNFNILFYEHTKQNDSQAKELIYVLQEGQTITFRKLISAQNLYKDFGGIGPNKENKTYLRSISNQMYKANAVINGIEAFLFNANQYIVFISGSSIFIYNITRGEIDQFETQRMGNKLTGCVIIAPKATLLIATLQTGIKKFEFNQSRQKFQEKEFRDVTFGIRMLKCAEGPILGDSIIYGITAQNQLILMNTQLKHSIITIPNASTLHYADICLANNKIPIILASCTMGSRDHQIIGVNLLNLQKQSILQYEFTSGIGKICVIQGQLLVEIKSKGFLIYKLNEFEREIGILPLMNEVQQVRKDNKGNLLILEGGAVESRGSISVYKVKRV